MKRKFMALGCLITALSVCCTVTFTKAETNKTNITTANAKTYLAQKSETTTSGSIGNIVGDVMNGLGSNSAIPSDGVSNIVGNIEGVSGDIDGAIDNFGGALDSLGGLGDSLGGIGSGSSGSLGDALGGIGSGSSGLGDALGGIGSGSSGLGDALGGVLGGSGNTKVTSVATTTQSYDTGIIIPVPAASQTATEAEKNTTTTESAAEGETVDYAATSNPYKKPTGTFTAGDESDGIKWIQWIFIFTGYGLSDDGITGVLDEDTIAVVKKLQRENQLTIDGNITEDVIKAAEVLYYQTVLGGDVSAIEVSSEATTGKGVSYDSVDDDDGNSIPVALLVVVLVIIWVLAIGGIVLLFVFKKKKAKASKPVAEEKPEIKEPDNKDDSSIKSLSDLFEEAEGKDK